jgi:hypothetical protein
MRTFLRQLFLLPLLFFSILLIAQETKPVQFTFEAQRTANDEAVVIIKAQVT